MRHSHSVSRLLLIARYSLTPHRPTISHRTDGNRIHHMEKTVVPDHDPGEPEPLYYHCMNATDAEFITIIPDRKRSDEFFLPAYEWLEKIVGFYPLFLAVGKPYVIQITGYADNWSVRRGGDYIDGIYQKFYRKKGEFPNNVVLAFDDLEGVFTDYDYWHIALNTIPNGTTVSKQESNLIFKPTWDKDRWINAALKKTHWVQLVVPELPLDRACEVFVRNKATKKMMEDRGFSNVNVRRIPAPKW